MTLILGIDSGLTVTKAVIFDQTGRVRATARRRVAQSMPRPRHVERDMVDLWRQTAAAIADALAACERPASDIAAVAATAHGDGLYLLDRSGAPLGPGILSLDSRAGALADHWRLDGTTDRALARTGQMPHASAPSAILCWLRHHDPDRFAAIGHVLACKDWLTFCLTGRIGTDLTEASTAFTDVLTQAYAPDIPAIFGLAGLPLPEIALPDQVVGHVTQAAAALTGLAPGTPVVAGLHDVTASALGSGGYDAGTVAIVAGTYSINETVTRTPRSDPRWFCRNGIRPGEWNAMSISPASATNYDWFLDTLCATDRAAAEAQGDVFAARIIPEIAAAMARSSTAIFHPYLFGAPQGPQASAAFFGLRGWQDRGILLRAVIEGIAFNHRQHVDALRDGFAFTRARLTGGLSRATLVAQLFADVLQMPVTTSAMDEAAAWGAALCAGTGVGIFAAPTQGPEPSATRTWHPDSGRSAALATRYGVYADLGHAMAPLWPRIDALQEWS
ncbi:carbohydrate kinase [Paracoccus gahaiensis]|uniref:Carbohydrate kinase n=1 Tax=Paracoccus gahaiensis TaxID=1706839 RepID=A0A4U0R997_9RHOB|nr:FGGY-family carbohydrate kinase [Paracoccus gahaiensis]TJZ91689.1 carbohydrate kinase [Paracoccus gahaiensis]